MFQGQIFDKLTTQRQREFQTLATNIMATTERLQAAYRWDHPEHAGSSERQYVVPASASHGPR